PAVAADGDLLVGADVLRPVRTDLQGLVGANRCVPIDADVPLLVLADTLRIVDIDPIGAAVVDRQRLVVLDGGVHVELAVDGDLLRPGGVVHRQLVVTAALVGVRLDAADDRACGETERGLALLVIDAAGYERLVGVAFEEIDEYLLAN